MRLLYGPEQDAVKGAETRTSSSTVTSFTLTLEAMLPRCRLAFEEGRHSLLTAFRDDLMTGEPYLPAWLKPWPLPSGKKAPQQERAWVEPCTQELCSLPRLTQVAGSSFKASSVFRQISEVFLFTVTPGPKSWDFHET